ncbi:kinase-like domain-containing protein, partial [Cyathus striatus]
EEQLTSSAGYYPGKPGKILDKGNWKIVRKLGWGSRSSTWLAKDLHNPDNIEAIKIFTVEATNNSSDAPNECTILQHLSKLRVISGVPVLRGHFYEESTKGRHLCLILHVLGGSVDEFRSQNTNGAYLPLHVTKKIISDVVEVLTELHEHNVVHGAVTPDNLLFSAPQQADDIEEYISSYPTASASETTTGTDGVSYPVIRSQPIVEDVKWNASATEFAEESIYLSNFKYSRIEQSGSSTSAIPSPESISGNPTDQKTDIWMLGYTTYVLLTGKAPFNDDITLETLQILVENLPITLPQTLSSIHGFSSDDIPSTVKFISSCLTISSDERPSADDLLSVEWIRDGMICSCGWCTGGSARD